MPSIEGKKKEGFQNFAAWNIEYQNVLSINWYTFLWGVVCPGFLPSRIFTFLPLSLRSYDFECLGSNVRDSEEQQGDFSLNLDPWNALFSVHSRPALSSHHMMKCLETHAGPHPSFPFIYNVFYSGQFGVQSPSPPPWILMPFSMPLGNHTFELLQPTKSCRYGFFHLECVFSSFSHPARLYSNKLPFVKYFQAPPKN